MVASELIPPGWSVTEKFRKHMDGLSTINAVNDHLLNLDMRDFGAAWLDTKGKDVMETNGQILQVVAIRNIAISQAEEDFQTSGEFAAGRLLRLTLTDGKTNIVSLDIDNSPKLSIETPPGTKIRLNGRIQIRVGFLMLKKNNFEVLKSSVESMVREWILTRDARGNRRSRQTGPDAPPPMVPFGSQEATKLIENQNQFLLNMRNRNKEPEATFDSLKLAMLSTTRANAAGPTTDICFKEKRKEIVAEVAQKANNAEAGEAAIEHKFVSGGSKFALTRAELAMERDRNIAQLVSMGYPVEKAGYALDDTNNNLTKAIDRLTSRNLAYSLSLRNGNGDAEGGRGSRGGRGVGRSTRGGRGRGRGGRFDPDIEDDPRFDPVAAAESDGLKGRPSSGPVPISDFMANPPQRLSVSSMQHPQTSSSYHQNAHPTIRNCIISGTVVQAKAMSGEYEAARIWGLMPTIGGAHVALVSYLDRPDDREEVPLVMIKTLDKQEITSDMLNPVKNVSSMHVKTDNFATVMHNPSLEIHFNSSGNTGGRPLEHGSHFSGRSRGGFRGNGGNLRGYDRPQQDRRGGEPSEHNRGRQRGRGGHTRDYSVPFETPFRNNIGLPQGNEAPYNASNYVHPRGGRGGQYRGAARDKQPILDGSPRPISGPHRGRGGGGRGFSSSGRGFSRNGHMQG